MYQGATADTAHSMVFKLVNRHVTDGGIVFQNSDARHVFYTLLEVFDECAMRRELPVVDPTSIEETAKARFKGIEGVLGIGIHPHKKIVYIYLKDKFDGTLPPVDGYEIHRRHVELGVERAVTRFIQRHGVPSLRGDLLALVQGAFNEGAEDMADRVHWGSGW